jgi:hypothetical protein
MDRNFVDEFDIDNSTRWKGGRIAEFNLHDDYKCGA